MASVMAVAVVLTACGGPPPVPDTKNLDELYQAAKAEGEVVWFAPKPDWTALFAPGDEIQRYLREQMPVWRESYTGVEEMKVAVMGCIVNGPGESKHADIGISLPGTGEAPAAPVFIDGQKALTLRGDNIAREFHEIVENYIEKRFAQERV